MTSNYANTSISMTIEPTTSKPTNTTAHGYFLRSYDNYGF